jgi:hypothetical protein
MTTLDNLGCPFSCQVSYGPRLRQCSKWKCHKHRQAPFLIDRARRHKPFRQNLQNATRRCGESGSRLRRLRQRPVLPTATISRNRGPATRNRIRRSTRSIASRYFRISSSGSWIGTCSAARDGAEPEHPIAACDGCDAEKNREFFESTYSPFIEFIIYIITKLQNCRAFRPPRQRSTPDTFGRYVFSLQGRNQPMLKGRIFTGNTDNLAAYDL